MLSFEKRGELSGYVFGKHGADILIPGVGIKLVKGAIGEFKILANAANAAYKADKVYAFEGINSSAVLSKITKKIEATQSIERKVTYHPRIRSRAIQDPKGHNFPYTFDQIIMSSEPIVQEDMSLLFRHPGSINSAEGFFEIAINPETNVVFHPK